MIKQFIQRILLSIPFLFYTEKYPLPIQMDIEDIYFEDQYILFIEKNFIKIYNPEKRTFLTPLLKPSDSVIGFADEKILICEWKNFKINSPEEYSTEIYIYIKGERKNKKVLKFHETIKPITCSLNILSLETSMPQLEKKAFEYSFESEKLKEIPVFQQHITSFWTNSIHTITVRKDIGNIVWIYRKVLKF